MAREAERYDADVERLSCPGAKISVVGRSVGRSSRLACMHMQTVFRVNPIVSFPVATIPIEGRALGHLN